MKITIRLRPGKDDGIREWYQAIPSGDRSRIIRGVLKDFINHKKGVVQNHSSDRAKEYADPNLKTGVKLKPSTVKYDDNNIDSKLDNLLDQI